MCKVNGAGTPFYRGAGDAFAAKILDTTCAVPGPIGYLMLARSGGDLVATWDDVPGVTLYTVFHDPAPDTLPATPFGSATTGTTGVTRPLPPDPLLFFRVAGENACGLGPR